MKRSWVNLYGICVIVVMMACGGVERVWAAAGDILWKFHTQASLTNENFVDSCPAIGDDGTIYFGSDDNYFYALNPDGTLKWKFAAQGQIETPAIASDGTIYFYSRDGYLYSIDSTGTIKWRCFIYTVTHSYQLISSPTIDSDGTIYISVDKLYAVTQDGSIKWSVNIDKFSSSPPVIGIDGTIYVCTGSEWVTGAGSLSAFNNDGTLKWIFSLGTVQFNCPAIDSDGTIYATSTDYNLYSINPNGTLKWKYKTEGNSGGSGIWSSPVIGNDGVIYFGTGSNGDGDAGGLYAMNHDGTLKWKKLKGVAWMSTPLIGKDNTIFFGASDGNVRAFDTEGNILWERTLPQESSFGSSLAINQSGKLYIGTNKGNLYAIDSGTNMGLLDTPWPKFKKNYNNTANTKIINISRTKLKFLNITPNSTSTQTFDISNVTESAKSITSISSDNPAFTVNPSSATIPAGGKQTVTVTFSPTDTKGYKGIISIKTADVTLSVDVYGNLYPAGEEVFKFKLNEGIIQSCAAIGNDGTIYISATDKYLYAINTDGTYKWRYQTGNSADFPPTIGNDAVYVYSSEGAFYAISFDGSLKWKYSVSSSHSPSIGKDGTLYIGNNGYVDAISPDGKSKWKCKIDGTFSFSQPVISNEGTIFVATQDGNIYSISSNGSVLWHSKINDTTESSISLDEKGNILGAWNRILYKIDKYGKIKWQYEFASRVHQSSPAIDNDGTIYIGTDDSNFYAINSDGTLKWKASVPWITNSSPAIGSDGSIYIGGNDGHLYVFNKNGELKWSFLVSNNIAVGPPTLDSKGIVYFGTKDFNNNQINMFYAIGSGTNSGLADCPWPRLHHDNGNSNSIQKYSLSSSSLDFGKIHAGETKQLTFTITNYDTADLAVSSMTVNDSNYTLSHSSATISSNQMNTVTVTFAPKATKSEPFTGTVTIVTNYGTTTISLTGSAPPPTIKLTSPNGGEKLESKKTQQIKWEYWDVAAIAIEFSKDNGTTWETIKENVQTTSSSYTWTVPTLESTQCLIRMKDMSNAGVTDASDSVFSVAPPPSITLTSPNGGEIWAVKSVHNITWTSYSVEKVWIEYSIDGGSSWRTISSNADAKSGKYSWTLPTTTTVNCRVKISDSSNGNIYDTSNATFSISAEPLIQLTSPNGGEKWTAGTTQSIKWTSSDVTNVKIEYTTDNGKQWVSIASSMPDSTKKYAWTVPNVKSDSCLVRITDTANLNMRDLSDGVFAISTSPGGLADSAWPMYRQNLQHTGSGTATAITSSLVKWTFNIGAPVVSSPAIDADGTVYIGDNGSYIYAVRPDGTLKWRYQTGAFINSSPAIGADGSVYIGSADHYLYVLKSDGTLKWKFQTGSGVYTSPAIANDGTVYVGSLDNYLYAVRPDGTLKWKYQTGAQITLSSPAIDADGTVYIGDNGRYLYAVKPDGTLKWKYQTEGGIHSSPVINTDGTVYVGSEDTYLYALNNDGTLKWKYQTGRSIVIASPAIGADGTVYVGSEDTYLYAIKNDGTLKWKYQTEDTINSSPSIGADGTVYVESEDSYFYALTSDGALKWKYQTGNFKPGHSSAAIGSDGTVYVGSYDGCLYAFAPEITGVKNLALKSPRGSETWIGGIRQGIVWGFSGVANIKIEYSTDNGANWSVVVASVPASSGIYYWTVPTSLNSTSCKIKITDTSTASVSDMSDGVFSISPSPGGLADSAWPMFRQNLQHTGRGIGTVPASDTVKWKFKTEGPFPEESPAISITSSPAIGADGTVYVGSGDSYLYAVNSKGSLKWKFKTGSAIKSSPATGADGTVYVGSDDSYLYAVNSDGTLKWKLPAASGAVSSSPAIGADGKVYVGSDDGNLLAVTSDGTLNWKFQTKGLKYSSPSLSPSGTVYVGSLDAYIYAVKPDGSLKWKFLTGERITSSPSVGSDGTVYVGSWDSHLYAINPEGNLKWKFKTESEINSSPAIGSDGTVYVGSSDCILYAVNTDGSLRWKFFCGNCISSSPAIGGDGTVYVGSYDNYLYAVNTDGSLRWKFKTEDSINSSPAIGSDGAVYVGSNDKYLYAFSPIPPVTGTIALISPNGGESWTAGTTQSITWTAVNVTSVKLDYSSDGGSSWTVISASTDASSGKYSWLIPATLSGNCILRITSTSDASLTDRSDVAFIVEQPLPSKSIALESPNGGEKWSVGSTQTITWTSSNVSSIKIEYSKNNGKTWTILAENVDSGSGSGNYQTTVPDLITEQCLIRVSDMKDATVKDISNGIFSIQNGFLNMVALSNGTFQMGQVIGGSPVHTVTINLTNFQMSATEVTQGQYKSVTGTNPYYFTGDDLPCEQVTWWEAIKFCNALSTKTGLSKCYDEGIGTCDFSKNGFRLPTEAEWEYACRAGSITTYNLGNAQGDLELAGWYSGNSGQRAHTVAQKTPNAWGLYDMHGNVYEWCQDWSEAYTASNQTNPTGAKSGTNRIIRGGGWNDNADRCGSAYRNDAIPDRRYGAIGFRVVRGALDVTDYLTIISPNGGESWAAGSSHNITWNATGITNVKLEYSTDNGTNWTAIIASTTASAGSYAWMVPTVPSMQCLIRVSDATNAALLDVSNTPFTITATAPVKSLTLASPNGGEKWTSGTTQTITWVANGVSKVKIEYSQNNGTAWTEIAGSVDAAAGSYSWTVPNTPSANCVVRVSDTTDATVTDRSDGVFAIETPVVVKSLVLVSPNGGEKWTVGASQNILWTSSNVTSVKVEYSTDNGVSWKVFSASTGASSGMYETTVPDVASTTCLIRVTDIEDSKITDRSDAIFTINRATSSTVLILTSPNGGESWLAGSTQNIMWTSENVSSIKIEYSIDGGVTWLPVVSSVPASEKNYQWLLPTTSSQNCRIKITNTADTGVGDMSNGAFVIEPLPSVQVLSPNGGERWFAGTVQNIAWKTVKTDSVKIEYSVNDGADWSLVTGSVEASLGKFAWAVPEAFSAACLVQIRGTKDAAVTDRSDGVFTIEPQPSLTLVSPNGGEKLIAGSISGISWTAINVSKVNIEYSSDNGANWTSIATNVDATTGTYSWKVPDISSSACILKVTSFADGKVTDRCAAVFTIAPQPFLTLTSPNKGEKWYVGSSYSITWTFREVLSVKIEYSKDGGTSWTLIANDMAASEEKYTWTVPDIPSTSCLIRITDTSDGTITDKSDGTFVVVPPPSLQVVSPNGGEDWESNSRQAITWSSTSVDSIRIELSANNGQSWTLITTVPSAQGTFTWTVTGGVSSTCLVRIADTGGSGKSDISDRNFTISSVKFIRVTSPGTGVRWPSGSVQSITWESSGISAVTVSFSSDNGNTWQIVADHVNASDGKKTWTVPAVTSTQYRVRIASEGIPAIMVESDGAFEVYHSLMKIVHTPIREAKENEQITFNVSVESDLSVHEVIVHYDVTGRNVFDRTVKLVAGNGKDFSGTLGSGVFTSQGMEYYIMARDTNGNEERIPAGSDAYSIAARVTEMISSISIEGGLTVSAYRLVSMPLQPGKTGITDQLTGKLPDGEQGVDWRLLQYVDDVAKYHEYPNIDGFAPGRAYWMIVREGKTYKLKTPEGVTVTTEEPFSLTLKPGWNLIGNPWTFPVSWDKIENPSGANVSVLYGYNGGWSDPLSPPSVLESWSGYAVRNSSSFNAVIKLHPEQSEGSSKQAALLTDVVWKIRVSADVDGSIDAYNYLGVAKNSSIEWDRYDRVEPPVIGDCISLSFPHDDWKLYPTKYAVDFKPPSDDELSWDFDVQTNSVGKEVKVTIDDLASLPAGYLAHVYDRDTGKELRLDNSSVKYISSSAETERHFRIAFETGSSDGALVTRPAAFVHVTCYPNPFNPSTTVQYEISQPGIVSVSIYNSLGQEVFDRKLGLKTTGRHEFVYEAGNLTSGLYFVKVRTEHGSAMSKMLFMK